MLDNPTPAKQRLTRVSDFERIETGWWDDTDVRRDYFIADDSNGVSYWVFRERGDSGVLYIHGLFG